MLIALALAAAAAPPATVGPEADALGRRLAATGLAATILPLIARQQTEELVTAHPELSEVERATLRATAAEVAAAGIARVQAASAHAYARALSVADLRAVVAFEKSAAAGRYRKAVPGVIAEAMKAVGSIDFKGDAEKAFCAKTGKVCAAK